MTNKDKAAIDFDNYSPEERDRLKALGAQDMWFALPGTGDTPNFLDLTTEKVLKKGNAFVVLGHDRAGPPETGLGYIYRKNTHCAAVDIVAGRMSWMARSKNENRERVSCNPNFKLDAARVYVSQKAKIDTYFGIKRDPGEDDSRLFGAEELPRSAVALKADEVRIISREKIKLVTRTDYYNSVGAEVDKGTGIELIANNEPLELQPLVKGYNLVYCLNQILSEIGELRKIVKNFYSYQRDFNIMVGIHTHEHNGAMPGLTNVSGPTIKQMVKQLVDGTVNVEAQLQTLDVSTGAIAADYLSEIGTRYINSMWNRTN